MLAAVIAEARPVGIEGEELRVAFASDGAFLKKKAEDPEQPRTVADALRELTGQAPARQLRAARVAPPTPGAAATYSEEEWVARFMEELDAEELAPERPARKANESARHARSAQHAADAPAGSEDAARHGRCRRSSRAKPSSASAGGGMVTVQVSGDLQVTAVRIAPEAVDPEDVEMLCDLVLAAVNEALRAAQELAGSAWRAPPAASTSARSAASASRACEALQPVEHLRPARPEARHRALEAARHRQPHRAAPGLSHPARPRRGCARARPGDPRGQGEDRPVRDLLQPRRRTALSHLPGLPPRPRRVCVVEEPSDVIPMERTHEYHGLYHVLGGALSPIDGIEPEDLKIAELYAASGCSRSRAVPPRADRSAPPAHLAARSCARSCSRRTRRPPAKRPRCTSLRACASAPRATRHAPCQRPAGRRGSRVRRRGHARQGPRRAPRGVGLAPRPRRGVLGAVLPAGAEGLTAAILPTVSDLVVMKFGGTSVADARAHQARRPSHRRQATRPGMRWSRCSARAARPPMS